MNKELILKRIEEISAENLGKRGNFYEIYLGVLNLMHSVYGEQSFQVQTFIQQARNYGYDSTYFYHGFLNNLKTEVELGLLENLQKSVTGEVLTDFLQLARAALEEKGDDAKNVAAVLTAALFEDTIRRLATNTGIPHIEKLADVLTELKNKSILDGTQVGVAQSYLTFRNKSLHAEWDKVGRETVASVLAFTEQLLLKHFS